MTEKMVDCWACEGAGEHPCDCRYCSTPEGRAYGKIGHHPERCVICKGEGKLPEGVDRLGGWAA